MLKKILIGFICMLFISSWSEAVTTSTQNISAYCPKPRKAGNREFYGQYFEDFILSIVFLNLDKGTYVDVGAYSPTTDSVTNYFYRRGWTGINIEPLPNRYEELVKARPKDVNVNVGISDVPKEDVKLYRIYSKDLPLVDALSTFDEKVLKESIKAGYLYDTKSVKVTTLNKVLAASKLANITFLKIDVEGKEKEVLNSVDLKKYRPQVLLIEATEPGTTVDSSYKWNNILLKNDYALILFDGLNSYYVAKEAYNNLYSNFLKAYTCAAIANKKYHVTKNKIKFTLDSSKQKHPIG